MRVAVRSLLGTAGVRPSRGSQHWELGKMAPASAIQTCPSEPALARYLAGLQRENFLEPVVVVGLETGSSYLCSRCSKELGVLI